MPPPHQWDWRPGDGYAGGYLADHPHHGRFYAYFMMFMAAMLALYVFWDVLMSIGSLFMLLAAVGVLRLPDLFTRMQASTKSSTLGAACILLAVAVHFGRLGVTTQAVLVIAFFFLTTPVAAHMIARAAYMSGVPLWEKTVMNDLQGRYDPQTHTLASPPSLSQDASEKPGPGS